MREIKLRAWDKDQKRFRTDLVRDEAGRVWCWNHFVKGYATQMNEECFVWVEFTGLHDKNGKEIWEGDIIETSNGIKEVKWGTPWAMLNAEMKVIGNIYER